MNKKSSRKPKKLSVQSKSQHPKTFKRSSQPRVRLFIDPASISSGWALFNDKQLVAHGTVAVDKKLSPFDRLKLIYARYKNISAGFLNFNIEEVHVEQLPRTCHIYTHYSVCAIGIAFSDSNCKVSGDIPIKSWQKHVDWDGERQALEAYKGRVESEDQLAAIGMGMYYVSTI